MKRKSITAKEFEDKFDKGEDALEFMDLKKADRLGLTVKRVSVDFPEWMINLLDSEAKRLDGTSQSIIKFWISERLEARSA